MAIETSANKDSLTNMLSILEGLEKTLETMLPSPSPMELANNALNGKSKELLTQYKDQSENQNKTTFRQLVKPEETETAAAKKETKLR